MTGLQSHPPTGVHRGPLKSVASLRNAASFPFSSGTGSFPEASSFKIQVQRVGPGLGWVSVSRKWDSGARNWCLWEGKAKNNPPQTCQDFNALNGSFSTYLEKSEVTGHHE